jgi:hypothetical protein
MKWWKVALLALAGLVLWAVVIVPFLYAITNY